MSAPNIGLNVANSGDYSKCCPRKCSFISRCCSRPDPEIIAEIVKASLSAELNKQSPRGQSSSTQQSPRRNSVP